MNTVFRQPHPLTSPSSLRAPPQKLLWTLPPLATNINTPAMRSFYTTALLLLAPSTLATFTLTPRATPTTHLYVCTDTSFRGTCKNIELSITRCYNMEAAFNDNVSSAGPDDGTFCVLYS